MIEEKLKFNLVFADSIVESIAFTKKLRPLDKIALIACDNDYLLLGKTIKDAMPSRKFDVITFDENCVFSRSRYKKLLNFSFNTQAVIAIGKLNFLNFVRYFSIERGIKTLLIPLDLNFSEIFLPFGFFYEKGIFEKVNLKLDFTVVIDKERLYKSKKNVLADGYCQLASKTIAITDYLINKTLNNEKINYNYIETTLSAIKSLEKIPINSNNILENVLIGELRLAKAYQISTEGSFGAETSVGFVLQKLINSTSLNECKFFIASKLLRIYEAFIKYDMLKFNTLPNPIKRLENLADLFKYDELNLVLNYKPYFFNEINEKYKLIANNKTILNFINEIQKLTFKLEEFYKYVYNGRQKRADFDLKQFKKSLILSAYIEDKGVLKLINDSGISECLV